MGEDVSVMETDAGVLEKEGVLIAVNEALKEEETTGKKNTANQNTKNLQHIMTSKNDVTSAMK